MQPLARLYLIDLCILLSFACTVWSLWSYYQRWIRWEEHRREEIEIARSNLEAAQMLRDAVENRLAVYRSMLEEREQMIASLSQEHISARLIQEQADTDKLTLLLEIDALKERITEMRLIRGEVRQVAGPNHPEREPDSSAS